MKLFSHSIFRRLAVIATFCAVLSLFLGITANLYTVFRGITPSTYAHRMLSRPDGRIKRALFSPHDNVEYLLRGLIHEAKRSIKIAAFTVTSSNLVQDLIDAHNRGVSIEIVADGESACTEYSKIATLSKKRIPVYLFCPPKRDWRALMHNKYIIFEYTIGGRPLIWTGSYNFTKSANERNRENVIILDDAEIVNGYKAQFEALKKECKRS